MLPLTPKIAGLDQPPSANLALQRAVPLLTHRGHPVIEEALANACADIRQCATGGSFLRAEGQIQSQRERIGHGGERHSAAVYRSGERSASAESLGTRTARNPRRLHYGNSVKNPIGAAEPPLRVDF